VPHHRALASDPLHRGAEAHGDHGAAAGAGGEGDFAAEGGGDGAGDAEADADAGAAHGRAEERIECAARFVGGQVVAVVTDFDDDVARGRRDSPVMGARNAIQPQRSWSNYGRRSRGKPCDTSMPRSFDSIDSCRRRGTPRMKYDAL
jgi:hypothetical protein